MCSIIQLIAYKQTGKDTFYKHLKNGNLMDLGYRCFVGDDFVKRMRRKEFKRVSFADRLKSIVTTKLQLKEYADYLEFNKDLDPREFPPEIRDRMEGMTFREWCIDMADDVKRRFGEKYFVNYVEGVIHRLIDDGVTPVITDTRFPFEIFPNSLTVRLFREGIERLDIPSETSLDDYKCDVLLLRGSMNNNLYDDYLEVDVDYVFYVE